VSKEVEFGIPDKIFVVKLGAPDVVLTNLCRDWMGCVSMSRSIEIAGL